MTKEEADDKLYQNIKRGDLVLYFDEESRHCRTLVAEVHDVRTLTLVLVPGFDVYESTEEQRLRELERVEQGCETQIQRRVRRFDRSTSDRANTWCGVH